MKVAWRVFCPRMLPDVQYGLLMAGKSLEEVGSRWKERLVAIYHGFGLPL